MDAHLYLYRDLMMIFVAALCGGLLAWMLRLPLIVGYVVGGIVISPFTPIFQLHDVHTFEELAEVGVVFLMFSVGFEFSIKDLLKVKWVAAGGGAIGIAISIGLATLVGKLLGWTTGQGVTVGAAVSVASTMVLARLLADNGAMSSSWGRVMIGITLVEDLAVVLMTVLLPNFSGSVPNPWKTAAWVLGKSMIFLIPLAFLALKGIPILLRQLGKAEDSELQLLTAIVICVGTAAVAQAIGFSLALGAFLAGLSISGSKDLEAVHDRIVPLRDMFVALFFVSLGSLIEPEVLRHNLPLLMAMILLIVAGKFGVWTLVVKLFGYPLWTAVAVAAGLTQIGELSFVIVRAARSAGMVGDEVFNATLAASLISIFLNVFIARFAWRGIKNPA